jgi:hypothetical protein
MRYLAALSAVAVAVAGCDHGAMTTITPAFDIFTLTPTEAEILAAAGITVLQPGNDEDAATGGIGFSVPGVNNSTMEEQLAFTALLRDGTARGQYQWRERSSDGERIIHGEVDCLFVVNNIASISGPITHVTQHTGELAYEKGAVLAFEVLDGGEGQDAHLPGPDFANPPTFGKCSEKIAFPTFPVEEGNAQVQDAQALPT